MKKENNILIILTAIVFVLILLNIIISLHQIPQKVSFKTCSYINNIYSVKTNTTTLSYSTAFNPIEEFEYPIKYENKFITNHSKIIIGFGDMCR